MNFLQIAEHAFIGIFIGIAALFGHGNVTVQNPINLLPINANPPTQSPIVPIQTPVQTQPTASSSLQIQSLSSVSGPSGTTVTIYGSGFATDQAVLFGMLPVTYASFYPGSPAGDFQNPITCAGTGGALYPVGTGGLCSFSIQVSANASAITFTIPKVMQGLDSSAGDCSLQDNCFDSNYKGEQSMGNNVVAPGTYGIVVYSPDSHILSNVVNFSVTAASSVTPTLPLPSCTLFASPSFADSLGNSVYYLSWTSQNATTESITDTESGGVTISLASGSTTGSQISPPSVPVGLWIMNVANATGTSTCKISTVIGG